MEGFKSFIEQYTSLPMRDWELIQNCIREQGVRPGEIIHQPGKICKKLYFLERGLLRYFEMVDGMDTTKYFTIAPYCFTAQRSFVRNQPSSDGICAIEDSLIWEMNKEDADRLLELKSWSKFVRELVQEVQYFTEEILLDLQNKTAEERYIELVNSQSVLVEKVPLKHLASYLGIAPQSLSRIRKKFYKIQHS